MPAFFGSSARASVIRTAIFFTPLFLASGLALITSLVGMWNAGPVLTVILLILTGLFGFQSIQSLRDLRGSMRTTRGPVMRIWSKLDVPPARSHYITVGRAIFRVSYPIYYDLREEAKRMRDGQLEEDYRIEVEVVHYPYTGTVEAVTRIGHIRITQGASEESS